MSYTLEQLNARNKAEDKAGFEINHIGRAETSHLGTRFLCGCKSRWKSDYHDHPEYARQEWAGHIREHGAEIVYPELA